MKIQNSRKAQVTMFILIGIVLLVVFGFLFYTASYIADMQIEKEANKVVSDLLSQTAIKTYVTACLDEASKEALTIAGKQGGVIWASQFPVSADGYSTGGYLGSTFDLNGITPNIAVFYARYALPHLEETPEGSMVLYNITYGLSSRSSVNPAFTQSPLFLNLPDYPYTGSEGSGSLIDLRSDISRDKDYLSPFAAPFWQPIQNKLIPLCMEKGVNAQNPGWSIPEAINSCNSSYAPHSAPSVQKYIQEYVAQEVKNCVEFESLQGIIGDNVIEGDVSTNITFGSEDVSVVVNYPIIIEISGRQPITRMLTFDTKIPVRFKEIYLSALRMVREDANNIFFDVQRDTFFGGSRIPNTCHSEVGSIVNDADTMGQITDCLPIGMTLQKITNVCNDVDDCTEGANSYAISNYYTSPHDDNVDVIRITDSRSNINGVPYVFQFAVENRKPALDYIHEETGNPYPDRFDVVAVEGDEILLEPEGYDPDEDSHDDTQRLMQGSYAYVSGWKQSYDEWFDINCCSAYGGTVNCVDDPYGCVRQHNDPNDPTIPGYASLPLQGYPFLNKWMTSAAFMSTNRKASVRTIDPTTIDHDLYPNDPTHPDMGAHEVIVRVCDHEGTLDLSSGYCDLQAVRILVMDLPIAVIGWSTIYPDIHLPFISSLEDPVLLNASGTIIVFGDFENYLWRDETENNVLYDGNKNIQISPDAADYNISISAITTQPGRFTQTDVVNPSAQFGSHIVSLLGSSTSPDRESGTDEIFSVFECVPHDEYDASIPQKVIPPFPYNGLSINGFFNDYSSLIVFDRIVSDDGAGNVVSIPGDYYTTHTCCNGVPSQLLDPNNPPVSWGTYKDTSTVCFDYTSFADANGFDNNLFLTGAMVKGFAPDNNYQVRWSTVSGGIIRTIADSVPFAISAPEANDIYSRTFERKCSGDRGNVCSGEATELRAVVGSGCTDLLAPWQDERCSGPPRVFADNPAYSEQSSSLFCENYTGTTFEKLFDSAGPWTGRCDNQPRCANVGRTSFITGSPKPYACLGLCGSGVCDTPDLGTCLCELSCGAHALCDGKNQGDSIATPPAQPICNNVGQPWFEDVCSGVCGIEDKLGNVCELTGPNCDYDHTATSGSYVGNDDCDGREAGNWSWSASGTKKEQGCENDCTHVTCVPYIFDTTTEICHTGNTASGVAHCDDTYLFDNSETKCMKCNASFVEIDGDTPDNKCEVSCGAANGCDEATPNTLNYIASGDGVNGWCTGSGGCSQHCIGWIDDNNNGIVNPPGADVCANNQQLCEMHVGEECEFNFATTEHGTCVDDDPAANAGGRCHESGDGSS